MKYTLLSFLICLFSLSAFSQDVQKYIPSNSSMVITQNLGNLDKKTDLDALKKIKNYDTFIESMAPGFNIYGDFSRNEEVIAALNNPASIGVSFMEKSHIVIEFREDAMNFGIVAPIADVKKLEKYITKPGKNEKPFKAENEGDFQYLVKPDGRIIAWSKTTFMMWTTQLTDNQIIWDEGYEAYEKKTAEANLANFKRIVALPTNESIIQQPTFTNHQKEAHDAYIWMNYESFMGLYSAQMDPMSKMMMRYFEDFYKNMFITADVNMENGAVNVKSISYMDGKMLEMNKKMMRPVSEKIINAMDGKSTLAYWAMGTNIDQYVGSIRDIFEDFLKNNKIGQAVDAGLDVLDMFLDEDEIYSLWEGDLALTFNGFMSFKYSYPSWEYNPDTDDYEETMVERTETLPKFSILATYKSDENIKKLARLGTTTSFLKELDKGYYQITEEYTETEELKFLFVVKDGLITFTNDEELAEKLHKGKALNKWEKEHEAGLKKNVQSVYFNIDGTITEYLEFAGGDLSDMDKRELNKIRDFGFEDMSLHTSPIEKDHMLQSATLNLKDKKENAFITLFKALNSFMIRDKKDVHTEEGKGMK